MKLLQGNRHSKNRAIFGDNLLALNSLKSEPLSVDIIYIDPPYNVGGTQGYRNRWTGKSERNDYTWAGESGTYLDFMEPRLKESHALLKDEGIVFISICDGEYHRLKVLNGLCFWF